MSSKVGIQGIVIAWEYKQERGYDFFSIVAIASLGITTSKG